MSNKEIIIKKYNPDRTYVIINVYKCQVFTNIDKEDEAKFEHEFYKLAGGHFASCNRDLALEGIIKYATNKQVYAYNDTVARFLNFNKKGELNTLQGYILHNDKGILQLILPDKQLYSDKMYMIAVFELVSQYKCTKALVYAINCLCKLGFLDIKKEFDLHKNKDKRYMSYKGEYVPLCSRYFRANVKPEDLNSDIWPESVYRYYRRYIHKYKKRSIHAIYPVGYQINSDIPKFNTTDILLEYTSAICSYVKLNYIGTCIEDTDNVVYADVRPTRNNKISELSAATLQLVFGKSNAGAVDIYSNICEFVYSIMYGCAGHTTSRGIYVRSEYCYEQMSINNLNFLLIFYHELAHCVHWRARKPLSAVSSYDAQVYRSKGATYEHHADKFAIWCCIVNNYTISQIYNRFDIMCKKWRGVFRYDVSRRYCRMLNYINNKYGKLTIPVDLKYVFDNDTIKCLKLV